MFFQLKSIVLWPRTAERAPRVLHFALGQLNIITGASKTGKSAIIPILDYCLGSERCAIPVTTIRNACSWFGVVISTADGEMLMARREPGQQQSTGDMFILEGHTVDIPHAIADKNTTVDAAKRTLDRLAGLSNLGFDPSDNLGGFKGRPSFRDLLAFTFQPQNIVANPDVLFFKADTMEHKEKLRTIFPYVLGAVTPDMLARRWEIDHLGRDLQRKERELRAQRQMSSQWQAELHGWLSEARDLGLLDEGALTSLTAAHEQIRTLETVVKKTSADAQITDTSLDSATKELAALDSEEGVVALQLAEVKVRAEHMTRLRSAVDEYSGALKTQRDRLQLSRWLRDLAEGETASCPICGGAFENAESSLTVLCDSLASIEASARHLDAVPAVFDREFAQVRERVRVLSDQFNGIRARRNSAVARSARIREECWRRASVDRFIGRMEQALLVLKEPQGDPILAAAVDDLKRRLAELRSTTADDDAHERQNAALRYVSGSMARMLPLLDSERPTDPVELNIDDLTIRVTGSSGRPDFLWEIGSGANWLSYHVASLLALHKLFLTQKSNPVPSFLVLDQPSQVYFPRKLAGKIASDGDPSLADEDVEAVKKVFNVLGAAIAEAAGALQVLCFDHAGAEVWSDAEQVHVVEEWREGRALVPAAWLT